jgi:hypothetical protein
VAIAALLPWWLAQKRRRWTQLNSCESAAYLYWLMNTTYYVLDISFKNVPQFECFCVVVQVTCALQNCDSLNSICWLILPFVLCT